MIDRNSIRRALAPLHASEDTIEEVLKMARHENTKRRYYPARRIIAVAAVIAVMVAALCGVGYAVYQFTLADAKAELSVPIDIVEETENLSAETETRPILVYNGLQDSPESHAFLEWQTWIQNWNEENPNWFSDMGVDDAYSEISDNYLLYGAFLQEHADKLDKIAEKYGLTLMNARASLNSGEDLYNTLGTGVFLPGNMDIGGDYIYDNGAFKVVGSYELANGTSMTLVMFHAPKGSFFIASQNFPEDCTEWAYETKSGVIVNLAMNDTKAYVQAVLENAYVTCELYTLTGDWSAVTSADVEALADSVDFSVLSKRFAAGSDTSGIARAVNEMKVTEDAARAEYEEQMAEENARLASITAEEWQQLRDAELATVMEMLGNYHLAELPEGYYYASSAGAVLDSWCYVMHFYRWADDPTYAIELRYDRHWDPDDHSISQTQEEFNFSQSFLEELSTVTEVQINGCDGFTKTDVTSGAIPNTELICWMDEEKDIYFTMQETRMFAEGWTIDHEALKITADELIELAESVVEQ